MLDLIWLVDAADQLDAIAEFISLQRPAAAEELLRSIDDHVDRIRQFPESARPGRIAGTRELLVHPNYIVVYRVAGTAIEVIRVLHARQRYP